MFFLFHQVLDKFVADNPEAPDLTGKVALLVDAKERMNRVNTTLDKIQDRLERLYNENAAPGREDNKNNNNNTKM